MERMAGDLTSSIIKKLNPGKEWYATRELLAAGLPVIIVERIRMELEQNLVRSLKTPETIWADFHSNSSKEAWKSYVDTIRNEVVLPAEVTEKVIISAADECFRLAIEPRKAVPEILFGDHKVLTRQAISERIPFVLINRHLATALSRYLEKKELQEITFEKASEVIGKIDEKLVEGYNPLNWKDLIMPIFALSAGSALAEHISLFFEDKSRPGIAKAFKGLDRNFTDTEFIEKMSSVEFLDMKDDDLGFTEAHHIEVDETITEEEEHIEEKFAGDPDEEEISGIEEEKLIPAEPADQTEGDIEKIVTDEETSLNDLYDEDEIYEAESSDEPIDISFDFSYDEENIEQVEEVMPGELNPQQSLNESDFDEEETEFHQDVQKNNSDSEPNTALKQEEDELPLMPEVEQSVEGDDVEEEEETLLSRFVLDDPDAEEEIGKSSAEKKPRTIYDELNLVKEEKKPGTIISLFDDLENMERRPFIAEIHDKGTATDEPSVRREDTVESEDIHDEIPEIPGADKTDQSKSSETDSDAPMWKSFLDRGDVIDDETPFALDDSEDDEDLLDEDGFIETPIFDFSGEDEPFKKAFGELSNWLSDDRERFISEIFGGSETAYDIALAEIINYENWKSAAKFLEREVFSRNRIDLYSEVAVDFTDRLHTYFLEYKS